MRGASAGISWSGWTRTCRSGAASRTPAMDGAGMPLPFVAGAAAGAPYRSASLAAMPLRWSVGTGAGMPDATGMPLLSGAWAGGAFGEGIVPDAALVGIDCERSGGGISTCAFLGDIAQPPIGAPMCRADMKYHRNV